MSQQQQYEEEDDERKTTTVSEGTVKQSISIRLIRHAESANNQVYRDARYIYRGGTPHFDEAGWTQYVDSHRSADPHISDLGKQQAQRLADYLVPHLANQASQPVQIVTSPMRRTLETIRPTLHGLAKVHAHSAVLVNGFYHESEGCHVKDVPEEGMNRAQVEQVLKEGPVEDSPLFDSLQFEGFPEDSERGWYHGADGEETRAESEQRAAKFFLWLCEYLDEQLRNPTSRYTNSNNASGDDDHHHHDVFDAGVSIQGEEEEDEHDKMATRKRKRRTCLLVGHGDFMSLLLKRIVSGFGHCVEEEGIPHRSAFVHFNTGMTELEYFGKGRFLVMAHNQTPHITESEYSTLRSGGSLKDGWSYLIPNEPAEATVKVAFDDELDGHVREQTQALKALYLKSGSSLMNSSPSSTTLSTAASSSADSVGGSAAGSETSLEVLDEQQQAKDASTVKHFIVHRGLQVVGCATYSEETGHLTDVAIRPSAGQRSTLKTIMQAVKNHRANNKNAPSFERSGSLLVFPRPGESTKLFEEMGFEHVHEEEDKEAEEAGEEKKTPPSLPAAMEMKH